MRIISGVIGFICVSVSAFFLTGYLCGQPSYYTWPLNAPPVAAPSAILFFLIGVAILILSFLPRRNDSQKPLFTNRNAVT